MFCKFCGTENKDNDKFCKKCGNSLIQDIREVNHSLHNNNHSSNKNLIIICITILIIITIISGTILLYDYENVISSNITNQNNQSINKELQVNNATFYLDGNPNTGITATINVGKEFTGENVEIMTTYSRDGSNLNNPSNYENHEVDTDGNIVITEYAPIPKYPDYCIIEIRHNNKLSKFGCNMGKYKGSQTSVPERL